MLLRILTYCPFPVHRVRYHGPSNPAPAMKSTKSFLHRCAFLAFLVQSVVARADVGAVDPAFRPPAIGFGVSRVAVQSDGKIFAVGGMRFDASAEPVGLLRLNPDGTQDTSFDIGKGFVGQTLLIPGVFTNVSPAQFYTLVPTPAGILVGGLFEKVNGLPRLNLARLLPTGSPDPAFVADADGQVTSVVPLAGGKLLIGGGFKKVNTAARNGIARLGADGVADNFSPDWGTLAASVRAVWPLADGKVLVAGGFTSFSAGLSQKLVVRLGADGKVDPTFVPPAAQFFGVSAEALLVQPDGKIIIIGGFGQVAGKARKGIARLNPDGTLDNAWTGAGVGPLGLESMEAIAAAPDGRIYVGGKFDTLNGAGPGGIARLEADGTRDATFKKPVGSTTFWVGSIAVQPDGKPVIAGTFTLGSTVDSTKVLLRLSDKDSGPPPPPVITREPADLAVNLGATGKSLVFEAAGTPPLTYRWQFNGIDLPFKTEATLPFLVPIKESDAGAYRVIVGNAGGSVTSRVAAVSVVLPARIVTQPNGLIVSAGAPAQFTVVPGGTPPFTFQWRKDLKDIPGATGATFSIPATKLTDGGSYSVAVANASGGETSIEAKLVVQAAKPIITLQPASRAVTLPETDLTAAALAGRRLCLTIAAALPPWIARGSYCIAFDGARYASPAGGALAGSSAGGFSVGVGTAPPATLIDFTGFFPDGRTATLTLLANGIYEFNRAGLVADQNGTWTLDPPFVPPAPPSVTFSVAATGAGALTYQWSKAGRPLPGQTAPNLVIDPVTVADAGDYTVAVTDSGSTTTSEVATLTVTAPAVPFAIEMVIQPNGSAAIAVQTTPGKTYVLGQQTALGAGNWVPVATFLGDGSRHAFPIQLTGPAIFYRVTVPR